MRVVASFSTAQKVLATGVVATAIALSAAAPAFAETASTQDLGGSTAIYVGQWLTKSGCVVLTTDYAAKYGYNWWHCEPVLLYGVTRWNGYVANV